MLKFRKENKQKNNEKWKKDLGFQDITGPGGPRILGIPLNASVRDAVGPQGWKLRRTRLVHLYPLLDCIRNAPLPHNSRGEDKFLWRRDREEFNERFSTSHTWDQIREHHHQVSWRNTIWFSQGIPRCCFIAWLAIWNRLSTGARMRIWGQQQACVLCGEPDETRDHLFFACPYSFTVWAAIAGKLLRTRLTPDWEETIVAINTLTGDRNRGILLRLCFQVSIYFIWRERNARIHGNGYKTSPQLVRSIEKLIRNRITSIDYSAKPRLRLLLQRWFMVRP